MEDEEKHEVDPLDMLELGEPDEETPPEEQAPKPDEQAPPAEEPESPKPPEGETELTEYEKMFLEAELDKQFPGGIQELIARQRSQNQYLTGLEQTNKQLRDSLGAVTKPKPEVEAFSIDSEELLNDPGAAVRKIQDHIRSTLDSERAALRVASEEDRATMFAESTPDFNQYREDMSNILTEMPELGGLPYSKAVRVIYQLAKARKLPGLVEGVKNKPSLPVVGDKTRARTGGGQTTRQVEPTPEDIAKMSDAEIERLVGVKD